jgi:hypothetical protein
VLPKIASTIAQAIYDSVSVIYRLPVPVRQESPPARSLNFSFSLFRPGRNLGWSRQTVIVWESDEEDLGGEPGRNRRGLVKATKMLLRLALFQWPVLDRFHYCQRPKSGRADAAWLRAIN